MGLIGILREESKIEMVYTISGLVNKAKMSLYRRDMKLNYLENKAFSKIIKIRLILDKLLGGLKESTIPRGKNREVRAVHHPGGKIREG